MYFVHFQIHLVRAISLLVKSFDRIKLNRQLSGYFPNKQLVFTDMGRSAFKIIIEKFNLQNSEILFPAYICDIFNPIFKKYNIKPIFLDIDLETFHIQIREVEKKLTPRVKAILICHTYGLPMDVRKIREIIGNQLLIIEDCAHSFGADTGNLGDAAFFSIYKQFPTIRGGLLVCPKTWQIQLSQTFFNFRDFISFLNYFPFFALFFKKFGAKFAPKMVRKEKLSEPSGINRASLSLFSNFLGDFEKSLENRKKLALFFQKELISLGFEVQESDNNAFCYLSALVPENLRNKRDELVSKLRKYRIFCTRIWHTPIALNQDEFPNTFEAAKRIINFPLQNHYTERDVKKIVDSIKKVIKL